MTRLSKSRIMSSLQCERRAHLEVHQPSMAQVSSSMEAAFATGHQVGDLAVSLYGGDRGTYIDYAGGGFSRQLAQTTELMSSMFRSPIFEATLHHDGVLVREDVLLPVEDNGPSWRIVEVKASTKIKPEHVHDCAVQAWVHQQSGYPLSAVALAHVDREFVYGGDGNFEGLLTEEDLTADVFELQPSVPAWRATRSTAPSCRHWFSPRTSPSPAWVGPVRTTTRAPATPRVTSWPRPSPSSKAPPDR